MGMGGLVPSIGVFLDTYTNGPTHNDPASGDHITIHRDGDVDHNSANNLAGPVPVADIPDCMDHTLRITWNPTIQIMTVYWDGAQLITYSVDLSTPFLVVLQLCTGAGARALAALTTSTGFA